MNKNAHAHLADPDLDRLLLQADSLSRGEGPSTHNLDPADPIAAAWSLGLAAKFEQPHAQHVTALTLSIFDQLVDLRGPLANEPPRPWARPRSRLILQLAATLHDIGCSVSYAKHHKHSHAMISASRLPGLSRDELQLVAVIARYHRKSAPKLRHEMYAALSSLDRQLVRTLASILRVGDALDRAHTQCVKAVSVSFAASALVLTAHAENEPHENLRACISKGRMLETIFGVELSVRWGRANAHSRR